MEHKMSIFPMFELLSQLSFTFQRMCRVCSVREHKSAHDQQNVCRYPIIQSFFVYSLFQ